MSSENSTETKIEITNESILNVSKRMEILINGISEHIGLDELAKKMAEGKVLTGYWGTAPTRSPSIGYLVPLMKFRDMVRIDINMTIFIADVHAFLDKGSRWIDRTEERTIYYIFLITELLRLLGVEPGEYEFLKGSEVQLDKAYIMDLFKLLTHVTIKQAQKAGSEVVKQNKEPTLSSLIYPLMQAIDETVLNADIELGGLDQRKIFALSRDNIDKIGYKKCSYIMNDLLPSLKKNKLNNSLDKMSSSDNAGKIEFLDSRDTISEKFRGAYCVEREIKDNPCIAMAKMIVYPFGYKYGDFDYIRFEEAWVNGELTARQLKEWLIDCVDKIIQPIRQKINENIHLYENAFM
jgi:tyrosyl-tRNA synthetase